MSADLTSYVCELGLDDHREYLLGIARPCVEILTAKARVAKGCSKFGGKPDLPPEFEWPHHKAGPYRFIGQVNLADVPKGPHGLPTDGLLSFFYVHAEEGESFPDYVRVFRFDEPDTLRPVDPPVAVRLGGTVAVKFQLGADVPDWPCGEAVKKWPVSYEQHDAYWQLRRKLHPSDRYLMGYPHNNTLAFDPTPGPGWRSLLTLGSDDDLEWCWHDGDWLVTFIEETRLRAGDFSLIKSVAG